jgi:hypothetical protein
MTGLTGWTGQDENGKSVSWEFYSVNPVCETVSERNER